MQLNQYVRKPVFRSGVLAVLLVFPLLAGCHRQEQQGPPPQQRVPQVSTITVQTEPVVLTSQLPGRTSAYRVAEIRPQVSGLIRKRLFTEGSNVTAGQILYEIEPAPFQAALDNAEAALDRAEATLPSAKARVDRFKDLVGSKAVSQQDYDDATAALAQVKGDIQYWRTMVETAKINLGYTKIVAPISGRIGKSNITDGAIVTAYQPLALATIQQLDPIYADMPQSTTDLLRLKRRMKEGILNQDGKDQDKVKLILEDNTAYPLEGTFQFSDIAVDQTTGSVTLRALFPNPDGVLLPGMFIQGVITEGVNQQAILVPQQGVSRDPKGNPYALIVDGESKAAFRPLTLDRAIGDKWLVATGLSAGDRVIVEGLLMLRPGTPVNATPYDPSQAGQSLADGSGAPAAGKPGEGGK